MELLFLEGRAPALEIALPRSGAQKQIRKQDETEGRGAALHALACGPSERVLY